MNAIERAARTLAHALAASALLACGLGPLVACAVAAPGSAPPVAAAAPPAVAPEPAPESAAPAPAAAPLSWPTELPRFRPDVPVLNKGLAAGTWAPDDVLGFDAQWVDEAALREVFTRQQAGRRRWSGFTAGGEQVPVDTLLADRDGPAVGYVFSLSSRALGDDLQDRAAVLHVRHRGRVRALWDGRVVLDVRAAPPGDWVEERVPVVMTGAYDVLLLKLGRGSSDLGPSMDVSVRVSAADGSAVPKQFWTSMRPGGLPTDLPQSP